MLNSTSNESAGDEIRALFSKELNRHGYGFQYAVLKKCEEIAAILKKNSRLATWEPLVSEFPVEVQRSGTKIDFILRRTYPWGPPGAPVYLLAECKRANPALSNWCFARAPYIHPAWSSTSEPLIVERFNSSAEASSFKVYHNVPAAYHIGLEVRSKSKGDKEGESGRAIENAASQVLRGLNGFVETLNQNTQLLDKSPLQDKYPHAYILPVIFTTADLWVSDANLSEADLKTGISDINNKELKPLEWLCYQYHTSPGIKHSRSPLTKPSELGTLMESEYIRTVPVVNPAGIEAFLVWLSGVFFE